MRHFDDRSDLRGDPVTVLQAFDSHDDGTLEGDDEVRAGDVHHDPWLVPSSPSLYAIADTIFSRIEENSPRSSRIRTDARERRQVVVENLVASLALLVRYHPEGRRLAIAFKKDASTRYDRKGLHRDVFRQVAEAMAKHGLLLLHKGARGQSRTTIEPTQRFQHLVAGMDIKIGRKEGAETIILKASTGRERPKLLINYEDTPKTVAMRAEMEAVNTALGASTITLGRETPSTPAFLTRRFQIDHPDAPHAFDQHGRLYGGFWMSLPKTERHLLRVNGEPIVDLDFAGCFVQLAYLEAGLALPNSDPYEGIEGLPRAAAKLGLSALLSRSGPMLRLPADLRKIVGPEWNAKRLGAALAERHPGIAPLFGRRIGLRLMKTESDILLAALRLLFEQGIPALPMHDGIMVPATSEDVARRAMGRASMQIVGTTLPVSRKEIIRCGAAR